MADCGGNMKLSPKHIEILNLYCGDAIGCNQGELAKRAGVSPRTVQRVLAEPEAHEIIKRLTDLRVNAHRPAIIAKLIKLALGGCTTSQRTYFQLTSDIGTGGSTNIVNVKQDNSRRDEETFEEAIRRMSITRWERAVPQKQE